MQQGGPILYVAKDKPGQILPSPLAVVSPGRRMHANSIAPDVTITLGDYKFLSSPTVLCDSDIDLILGMD